MQRGQDTCPGRVPTLFTCNANPFLNHTPCPAPATQGQAEQHHAQHCSLHLLWPQHMPGLLLLSSLSSEYLLLASAREDGGTQRPLRSGSFSAPTPHSDGMALSGNLKILYSPKTNYLRPLQHILYLCAKRHLMQVFLEPFSLNQGLKAKACSLRLSTNSK